MYDINAKNHFSEQYLSSQEKEECKMEIDNMVCAMQYVDLSYKMIKWHCDNLNVSICNASRGREFRRFPLCG